MDAIELSRLQECERVIERGLKTFTDVGNALLEIRDSKLYRAEYGTFEDYCRDRWGWERRHAYRMIEATQAVENVSNWTQLPPPANEAQARPLTKLEPEQQREVWQQVIDTAPMGVITAAHVQNVVDDYIAPAQQPHVTFNSGNNEWYTPPEYIAAARSVMGDIDLDPASSPLANKTVCADVYYTESDNGLSRQWAGRVWMNPPYASDLIGKFCEKLADHYVSGDVTQAIVLVNNATETAWFNQLITVSDAVVFTKGRVKFLDMDGNRTGAPLQGQAVIYMGDNPDGFLNQFSAFGWGAKVWRR